MVLDGYLWPMLAKILMDLNSLSQLNKHHGLMVNMLFLAKLSKEWYVKVQNTSVHYDNLSKYNFLLSCKYILILQSVVRKIEQTSTDSRDRPQKDIVITDSGAETVAEPFSVSKEDATD